MLLTTILYAMQDRQCNTSPTDGAVFANSPTCPQEKRTVLILAVFFRTIVATIPYRHSDMKSTLTLFLKRISLHKCQIMIHLIGSCPPFGKRSQSPFTIYPISKRVNDSVRYFSLVKVCLR